MSGPPTADGADRALPEAAFRSRVQIRFSHTEAAGIVYFPNYFDMMQSTIEDWFTERLGHVYWSFLTERKMGWPMVHASCDFAKPSRMGEVLELGVLLDRVGRSSLSLDIVGLRDGELRFRGRMVTVAFDLATERAVPIPEDLRASLAEYQAACGMAPAEGQAEERAVHGA